MRLLPFVLAAFTLVLSACDTGGGAPQASVRYTVDSPAAVTFTGADGASRASQTSAAFQAEVAVEPGTPVVLTAVSTTGAPITATIVVDGALVGSRQGRSVRVESSSDRGAEAEVRGPVQALGTDRVTVGGIVFVVDAATRLYDRRNNAVPLSTFVVGTYVEAEGRALGGGTFQAKKIKLEDEANSDDEDDEDEDDREVEVSGALQVIEATSLSVGGRRFATTAATRYIGNRGETVARSSFRVGDLVEVDGYVLADGTLQARKVSLDD